MLKKLFIFGGLLTLCSAAVEAQQVGQFSQYVQNPMILNPAATGIYDYTDINLSMRRQWTGLNDAPNTYYLSVNSRLKKKNSTPFYMPSLRTSQGKNAVKEFKIPEKGRLRHGLGGYLMMDEYGAFQKLTGNVSYALHIPLGDELYFSIGAGLGASNIAFDRENISLTDQVDNTYSQFIANGTNSTYLNLNLGGWLYTERFFLGYSTNQLLGDAVSFGDGLNYPELELHHFATIGYKIKAGENFDITPSALFKLMNPSPASFDLTLKAEYREQFWAGVSYRNKDAIIGLLGFNINNVFKLGYSYDFSISELSNYNSGGHEVLLGVMLGRN